MEITKIQQPETIQGYDETQVSEQEVSKTQSVPTTPLIGQEDGGISLDVSGLDGDSILTSSGQSATTIQHVYNDPNRTGVTIDDHKTPVVILFGPPSCGKTMTLIRLTRFLKSIGYTVEPIRSFRPKDDENYTKMCNNFGKMINSDDAAKSTANVDFMLVRVLWQGRAVCQILEGPGELYFNPDDPKADYPAYLNSIASCPNRKVWLIMLEPEGTNSFMDPESRACYVDKIRELKKKINNHDKVVFVLNKVDMTPHVINPRKINCSSAYRQVQNLYPNIFEPFKCKLPIVKWICPCNFDFVPFQTGSFTKTSDGGLTFQTGSNAYPQRLWNVLQKRINGGWL